jgi:hypothetical protein
VLEGSLALRTLLSVEATSKACTNRQEPSRDPVIQADRSEKLAIHAVVEQGIAG